MPRQRFPGKVVDIALKEGVVEGAIELWNNSRAFNGFSAVKGEAMAKASSRRTLLQLGGSAVVVLIGALFFRTRGPEQLSIPAKPLSRYSVHHGEIFWTVQNSTADVVSTEKNAVYAMPVTGGPARLVAEERPDVEFVILRKPLFFTDTDVFYTIRTAPPRLRAVSPGGGTFIGAEGPAATPQTFLGTFRPGKAHPVTGEIRRRYVPPRTPAVPNRFFAPIRLRRAPISGGPSKTVENVDPSTVISISNNWIYWIKREPADRTDVTIGTEFHIEETPHSTLMATSANTGETRRIAEGISADQRMISESNGVCWTAPRPFPDPKYDLYGAGITSPQRLLARGFSNINELDFSDDLPELDGRIYWIEFNRSHDSHVLDQPLRIVSAESTGSDRRTEVDLAAAHVTAIGSLRAYHGSLYFACSTQPRKSGAMPAAYVCRLRSGNPGAIERIQKVDAVHGIDFDGDYCYFRAMDKVRPILDVLTGDDIHIQNEYHLYRFALPR